MNDMDYGERKKIGLIYPSAGWVMEQELNEMTPDGVSIPVSYTHLTLPTIA